MRLGDAGFGRCDKVSLRFQFLFLFNAFALLVAAHDAACETVLGQLFEGLVLRAVVREDGFQLLLHLGGGRPFPLSLDQPGALLGQGCRQGRPVGAVLRFDFPDKIRRIVCLGPEWLAGKFGIDAADRQPLARRIGGKASGVGLGDQRVHLHQDLAGMHARAFPDQNPLDDTGLGRLHDFHVTLWDQLAFCNSDDVELAEDGPQQQGCEEGEQHPEHALTERIGRPVLQTQQRRREIQRVRLRKQQMGSQVSGH